MNIEGVNLLSLLSTASNTEGSTPSLSEKNAVAENFTNALIGQIKMLGETKGQIQSPGQQQNIPMPQPFNSLVDTGGLLKNKGAGEEISTLLDKNLPSSYKKTKEVDLNKDGNLEATLLALTDTLKSMPSGMIPNELAAALNSGNTNIMPANGLSPEKHLPEGTKFNLVDAEHAASGDFLEKETVLPQVIKDVNLKTTLLASTNSLKSVSQGIIPDESAAKPNNSNINTIASNGLSPEKHLPEGTKLNLVGVEHAASEDPLQKETVLPRLSKDVNLESNLPVLTGTLKSMPPGMIPHAASGDPLQKETVLPRLSNDVNLESNLPVLTGTLKSMPPGMIPHAASGVPLQKETTPPRLSKDVNLESNLPALTGTLKSMPPGMIPDAASGDPLQKETTPPRLSKDVNLESNLPALTGTLKSMPPGMIPDELATALNSGNINIMAANGQSPEKLLSEGAKLNLAGGKYAAPGDSLQKDTVLPQLIRDGQGFNLQAVQSTEPTEKIPVVEKHVSNPEQEKTMSGLTSDMIPFHSPVDTKADSPAISRTLDHPGWSKDLGEQIVWMNNKTMSSAEIKLNPEHLGPISVRIDIHQDQASIMFTAHHAEVKDALESSIPKLREMLGAQQLNLLNVNISQNSTPDQGRSQSQSFSKMPENHDLDINGVADLTDERAVVSKGLLSIYA
jgi:hypothetical protein